MKPLLTHTSKQHCLAIVVVQCLHFLHGALIFALLNSEDSSSSVLREPTSNRILAADPFYSQESACYRTTSRKNWLAQWPAAIDRELSQTSVLSRFGKPAELAVAKNLWAWQLAKELASI